MNIKAQVIKDESGRDVAVVLDMDTFREIQELVEDIEAIRIIEELADEPTVPWEEVKAGLA